MARHQSPWLAGPFRAKAEVAFREL